MISATQEVAVTVTPRNRANFRRLKANSIQSLKRWEKENELLYAMMEDESEWLAKLFPDVIISPDFFFYALEDGSLLCRLANYIQEKAESYSREQNVPVPGKKFRYHTMSKCGREIKLFRSRENVQQFLTWCRSHDIPEAILFESNDVVEVDDYREGCRGIIICLMEIVRRTSKFDLDELPQLIQMEKEIEEDEAESGTELNNGQGQVLDVEQINNMNEIDNLEVHQTDQPEIQSPSSLDSDSGVDSVFDQEEGENSASRLTEFSAEEPEEKRKPTTVTRKQTPPKPKDQKSSPKTRPKTKQLPSLLDSTEPKSELDKQVCKIAQDYNIKIVHRLKEGKYIILGRVMFVRMLNDHMLVRIGGGWDTLEHYLMTHVPSKQGLDNPSLPSSQAFASPRNSISAGSGNRNSLFEKVKRKEQIGIIRDSPVYSSQGSLNQLSAVQSTPKKKLSLVEKDEKDITDAIRKIESSVSQNLATRPASFTSKAFHQLKSRFDKGIFGTSRRTSSPDLSLKVKKISRRLSDTCTMADIASSLAFDGGVNEDQASNANNNDSDLKQTQFGETEEVLVGRTATPSEDLLGNVTLQKDLSQPIVSDDTDGSGAGDNFPTTHHVNGSNWTEELQSGPMNGTENYQAAPHGENLTDISSFDPFAAAPDQDEIITIDTSTPSEAVEEQPKTNDGFEQISSEPDETEVASTPRIDLGDLLADSQSAEAMTEENTVESSFPVILEDLLPNKESSESRVQNNLIDSSPTTAQENEVPEVAEVKVTNSFEKIHTTEEVKREETVVNDILQDVPSISVDLALESELDSPKFEQETAKVEEPILSEDPLVDLEGEGNEAEEEVKPVETEVKPGEEETKPVEEEVKLVEEEGKSVEGEVKPVEEEAKPVEAEVKLVEEEAKSVEAEVKPVEEEANPVEAEVKLAEEEAKTVEAEVKPAEAGVKSSKVEALKTEKHAEKGVKTKPQSATARTKSPLKATPVAKTTGTKKPASTTSTKAPSTSAPKKDIKPPATKTPATKSHVAKAPATKATASNVPDAKKPTAKTTTVKADKEAKPERPKSAATARPPMKTAATGTTRPASVATKKPPASTSKPASAKVPGKDVNDARPPKSLPKTTASRPTSAKPTPLKTSAPAPKSTAAKPSRPQSAKPSDKTDGAAKQPTSRPQSAKPTTTTTTAKKTTTSTTTRSGVAPVKTTTTRTVTEVKSGDKKTRPASAVKNATGAKSTVTGPKSEKPGGKPNVGTRTGRPSAKAAPKKKAEQPAKEKEETKQDEKPVSQLGTSDEPSVATNEKPSEVVEIVPDEKPAEVVETVSEESTVETSPEEKTMELTPESAPAEQDAGTVQVSLEGVKQSNVVTQIVTSQTTTIFADGEEQSTTTTEETTFEPTVGES